MQNRCSWANNSLMIKYHDEEWGRTEKDDNKLFELLILEGMQSGLSWNIILSKRKNLQAAFFNFDYKLCSNLSDDYLISLINNEGIIRSKLKIFSVRTNAQAFIKVREEFTSFYNYIWSFVDYKKINNKNINISDIVSQNTLSEKISKDLKKRGFKFIGPKIIYSYLQAIGIINDHLINCICYSDCSKK